ncbi:lysophospholipid acyltransferase family protein [Aquimonas sp.]|jgi:putative hemolysin|uniref:lysophospholipid acyltransferase family protein n=1 Tax=Aquimonas sp. TaxID=1872588 RepID=UPI0037BE9AA6
MIDVEQRLYVAFPWLAQGAARAFARPVVELLRRVTCEAQVNGTLAALRDVQGLEFVEGALEHLQFSYRVAPSDRENIPSEGRVLIVANHPLGALDALSLLHLVGSVRRDVRILANEVLNQLEPLRPLLIGLDVFGGEARGGLRAAYRALENEEAVIVFPAGEVSRIRPQGVRDGRWSDGFLRFARKTGAGVVPVHIDAQNSAMFYGVSMLAKPLATLMLPREIFAARAQRITLTVGAPVPSSALQSPSLNESQLAQRMRTHTYRLARRKPPMFVTSSAIAHPQPPLAVRDALRQAERLGATADGKQILLLDAELSNPALKEIGRLRELSFRAVGEGTGCKRDLDRFDAHYRHIVLWDEARLEIVGAYRLGEIGAILQRHGLSGLYSASLFDYAAQALPQLAQSVELGRSFVQPRFWGSRSLDYLWQGIGAYLAKHPELRYLIGPVSLSASLPPEARDWIIHCHQHFFGDREGLAQARNPHRLDPRVAAAAAARWDGRSVSEALAALKAEVELAGASVPTLYRQYVDLCEPEGVRFLAFGADPDFGHCVDGLIRVDLQRIRPHKRARYIDRQSAQTKTSPEPLLACQG